MGIFDTGRNCWRINHARRAAVLIDGENYMRAVRKAMAQAQDRIILVGWDFDARIKMFDTKGQIEGPLEVSHYISWLVKRNPDLHVYILRWDYGSIKSLFRGKTIFTIFKWFFHPRIHLELDQFHPPGAAQHQKLIVIDADTAFCGGIDLTDGRWDTRAHSEDEPKRAQPRNTDSGPWHDASMIVEGAVAAALGELAEAQWKRAGGEDMVQVKADAECWPDGLAADFENIEIAIARTVPEMKNQTEIREIEALYCDLIASAEHSIYAESQFFASRIIARAIRDRLSKPNPPEIVIVNPIDAEGWLESKVMDTTRARLLKALEREVPVDRFRVYHPVNEAGSEIYVHAKIMIVDDRLFRIGSSNLNNRSMGFDTECDIAIDASGDAALQAAIARIRNDLIAEHLGVDSATIARSMKETGSLIETIQLNRKSGRTLRDYQFPDLGAVEKWLGEHDVFNAEDADDEFAKLTI